MNARLQGISWGCLERLVSPTDILGAILGPSWTALEAYRGDVGLSWGTLGVLEAIRDRGGPLWT
eukprot:5107862-Pyramimonas_sp.AAC.1